MRKIAQQLSKNLGLFPIVLVLLFFVGLYLIPLGISAAKMIAKAEVEIRAAKEASSQFEP